MTTELPVPIEFRLPDGWQAVSPDEAGAPGAAFAALNVATQGSGFTANITIDGQVRSDGASLAEIADESVANLRTAVPTVTVANRADLGGPDVPGLTQDLRITLAGGQIRELVQAQVYLAINDSRNAGRRAVVRTVLTASLDQFSTVIDDYREFLSTVRLDTERV